jgi:Cu(I)/Ag(I) efflux system periplasmic protein CusF
MKALKQFISIAILGLAASASLPAWAQAMADGEVRKVDKENRKITLKHGEIKSLDMPPMTMVFQVGDTSLLDKVKAGDKVQFSAVNQGGKPTVTQIKPVK